MKTRSHMHRLLAMLLTLAMVATVLPLGALTATAATEGIFTYTVQDGQATITKVDASASGTVTIPATIGRFPVVAFGGFGSNRNVTEVIISEGVQRISGGTFYYCENIQSVTIPESVTFIGNEAFSYCMSLKCIDIPGNVETIAPNTFNYCPSMTSVRLPDTVTSIGESAFQYCYKLTDINFPASLQSIGDLAFSQCKPKAIDLPVSLTSIGENVFLNASGIESITVESGNPYYHAVGNCLVDTAAKTLILGCDNSVILPDSGIETIGSNAFAKSGLTEVNIPHGVKTIGFSAFSQCTSLKSVTIAGSVDTIEGGTFSGCSALETVELSEGLQTISYAMFKECTSLAAIEIPGTVTSIGYNAFYRCTSLTDIAIPSSVSEVASGTFEFCSALERVTLGEGITSIKGSAFRNCPSLKNVTIPQSVTTIGNYAFMSSGLTSICLGSNLTSIGTYGFQMCNNLTDVWYAGEDKANITIGDNNNALLNATWHCGACKPDAHVFDSICDGVCDACGYDRVASHIFDNDCDDICNLCAAPNPNAHTYVDGICTVCGDYQPITGTTGDCTWTLKGTVLTISGNGTTCISDCLGLAWGTDITEVIVEEGVTNLDGGMFYECTKLSKVSLPGTLTAIEWAAFYGCIGLESIGIPMSVQKIGNEAFDLCTSLTDIWYEGNNQYAISIGDYNDPLWAATWHYESCAKNPNGYDHVYVDYTCRYCQKKGNLVVSLEIIDVERFELANRHFNGEIYYYDMPTLWAVVTFADGTKETVSNGIDIDGRWYSIETNWTQLQWEETWALGNRYPVTGTLMGVSDTFYVTIVENPITAVEIHDVELRSFYSEDYDGNYYYLREPYATVTYQDGSTETIQSGMTLNNEWYEIDHYVLAMQDREPWAPGNTYTVTGTLMGISDTFNVTILKNYTLTLQYPSLSFEDEILYNVYYSINDTSGVTEMGMVTFDSNLTDGTIDNAADVIPGFVNSGSTYMVQSRGVPAKNLGDALYFKVYAKLSDGSYVYSDIAGYHAVAYANTVLNSNAAPKAKALVVAMLNYGAAAQEYFGYKIDSLMNAGLTAEQQALVSAYDDSMVADVVGAASNKIGSFLSTGGYTNIWPTVSFEGAFSINFYFTPGNTVDASPTMYYWDAETYNSAAVLTPWNAAGVITMEQDGSNWGAAVEDIAAKAVDETIYVAGIYTSNGTTYCSGVIAYSLGKYCKTIADKGNAFGAATAVYGYYAKAYFN